MRLEGLTIALRARTPWEATDLGVALLRAHARRIWTAWLLTTLPVFTLVNAVCWPFGVSWLAPLVMWWLKPMFDRVPLFVLSRATFGEVPSLRETLHAQLHWGWRGVAPWLLWRRLHPGRAMLLPVDLLEGMRGAQRGERVRVLSSGGGSPNVMLTIIGVHLESMLSLSLIALVLMFVPTEFLSDSAKAVWDKLFQNPPAWARVLLNFDAWIATSLIEPVFISAGFGLYLNRRVQLEGWDIELNFRRIAARLTQATTALAAALLLAIAAAAPPARAAAAACPSQQVQEETETRAPTHCADTHAADEKDGPESLREVFAGHYSEGGADFAAAIKKAYADADLSGKRKQWIWSPRTSKAEESRDDASDWRKLLGSLAALVAKFGLWIAIGIALVAILVNHRRWLPWIVERLPHTPAPAAVEVHALAVSDERLPDDIAAAVHALWLQGRPRAALALLYRASLARLTDLIGAPLPPGATESDCLRAARKLRDHPYAALFARIVRCWQAAAYAQRLPLVAEVDALLADWNATREAAA